MPSTMIHLLSGLAFTHSSNLVQSKPQFFLGCIAPDCVNLHGFAPKATRTQAHLRDTDLDHWIENVMDFFTAESDISRDMIMGYCLHNITDMAWDKRYDSILWDALNRTALSQEQRTSARWDEFYRFDLTQFDQPWWNDEVAPWLRAAIAESVNGLDTSLIDEYLRFVLDGYEQSLSSVSAAPRLIEPVVTPELVNEFIYYAVAQLKNQL